MVSYRSCDAHGNHALKAWIQENRENLHVEILSLGGDISKIEIEEIRSRTGLFNIDHGHWLKSAENSQKIWSAGHTKCPTDIWLLHVRNRSLKGEDIEDIKTFLDERKRMTDQQRLTVELDFYNIFSEKSKGLANACRKWATVIQSRLTANAYG